MVIYLDSSAAVKLAHVEEHSDALREWLNSQADLAMFSSVLAEVEVYRALHRSDPAALPHVPPLLARIHRVDLNATVRDIASAYRHRTLRSLDAIHLATARFVASAGGVEVAAFVAYDSRLLGFAEAEGFTAIGPV